MSICACTHSRSRHYNNFVSGTACRDCGCLKYIPSSTQERIVLLKALLEHEKSFADKYATMLKDTQDRIEKLQSDLDFLEGNQT